MNPFGPPGQPQPSGQQQPGQQQPGQQANYFTQQNTGNPFDPANFERTAPPAPPRPPSRLKKFAVSAGVSLAVAACGSGVKALFDDDDEDKTPRSLPVAAAPTGTSPTAVSPTAASTAASPVRSSQAPPSATANPLDAVDKGDCLKNTGTDADPEMVPVACGSGTYQVLKRVYGTIDANQCQSVSGATTTYTVTYYRNGITQISRSYVFCLKKR